jgi:hypothetical protein
MPSLARAGIFLGCVIATACASRAQEEVHDSESTGEVAEAITGATVQDALSGCSTAPVAPLDDQIIAEVNCAIPNQLSPVPKSATNFSKATTTVAYLETPARDALVTALAANPGMTLSVNSMLRTVVQQYLLYAWYQQGRCGISLAALPGNSNHETGLALDTSDYDAWKPTLEAHGFKWFGSADVVHFDYVGAGSKDLRGEDVKAFQRLWNLNNPGDKITVDGSYGAATEARIKQSPSGGFPIGASCTQPDAGTDAGKDASTPPVGKGDQPASAAPGAQPPGADPKAPDYPFLPPTARDDASHGGCSASSSSRGDATLLLVTSLALVVARLRRSRRCGTRRDDCSRGPRPYRSCR